MKKLLFGLTAALCASMAWAFSDSDADADGHAFNDTTYYVQATQSCADWGCTALFNNADYWSDGLAPHAKSTTSPNDYYLPIWKNLSMGAHWGYAHQTVISEANKTYYNPETGSNFLNRVALGSLTVAPRASLQLTMASDPVDYAYTFNDLRLRPQATVQMGDAAGVLGFCFKGKITILSEDAGAPSLFLLGTEAKPLYIKSDLVGTKDAQVRFSGETAWGEHGALTGNIGLALLTGDNSAYQGTIGVGANIKVLLGSDVPNGTVTVNGKWFDRFTYDMGTSTEHTTLGVCRTDCQPVTVSRLVMTDGTTLALAGIFTNGTGIVCSSAYTHSGTVTLDCTGCDFSVARYNILTVPSSESLDVANFKVTNLADEGYGLIIVDNDTTKTLQMYNPSVIENYVTLVRDDANVASKGMRDADGNLWADGHSSDCSDYAMYYGTNYWANNLLPSIEDGPNHDYLIPAGLKLFQPVSWAVSAANCGAHSANRDGHLGKFYGKSLTIASGATLSLEAVDTFDSAIYYSFETDQLYMMPGSELRHDLNGWNTAYFSMKNGTMTIKGTESSPVSLWIANTRSSWTANGCSLYNAMNLAGKGVLCVAGGAASGKENNGSTAYFDASRSLRHEVVFYGDNTAFTGTIKVGGLTNEALACNPLWGNVDFMLGASGLANASLEFVDGEPSLGAYKGSGALIPIENLTLADGTTILANQLISNNAGYGYKVTGSYQQNGVVTIDMANTTMSMRRLRILQVPTSVGTLDISKFQIVNMPEGYTFQIETAVNGTQVLTVVNPSVKGGQTFVFSEYWGVNLVKDYSGDDIVDAGENIVAAYSTLAAITDTTTDDWYQFYTVNEGGVTKLYVENFYCMDWDKYDALLNGNDAYDGDSSFWTAGQWSDGLAPHAGRYYEFRWKSMAINFSGAKTFGGTSLTLGDTTTAEWSEGATAEIAVYTSGADLTFPDLRWLENTRISVAMGVTDLTLRGKIHFLANVMEGRIVANGANFKLNMAATLLGGKNRILRLPGQTGCEFNVTGDATGYAGQIKAESGYTVGLGTLGLPTGTVNLTDATTAVRSIDPDNEVDLNNLTMVDGATIRADRSAKGIVVSTFTPAGKVKLDFGTKPVASKITVLTVPATADLSVDTFTVARGFTGGSLSVETTDTTKSLVYEFTPGLAYDTAFTSIDEYNTAILGETTAATYANTDTYLVVSGITFNAGTDYSLAKQVSGSTNPPKLHVFFYDCTFPTAEKVADGTMSPDNGDAITEHTTNRKMIALCTAKEVWIEGCTFNYYDGDSYVIDLNLYNNFENDGCGITIKNNNFKTHAGKRVPISVKNKTSIPPAFVLIEGNTFAACDHDISDTTDVVEDSTYAGVICFGDQSKSTGTKGGANFPVTIKNNKFAEGVTQYVVMSGMYVESGKQGIDIDINTPYTWFKVGDTWTGVPAFASDAATDLGNGVKAELKDDGTCTINASSASPVTAAMVAEKLGKSNLKSVTLGAGITSVDASAFAKCYNLSSVTFNATGSVSVGANAFLRCNSLESIVFNGPAPDLGDAITLQSAIYMKDGMPEVYTIPTVTVSGYTQKTYGTNDLKGDWTEVTSENKKSFHFFKVVLEKNK